MAYSGQITIATAGTAVQGSDTGGGSAFYIKALSGNSGLVYVGNDGADDVTSSNGFELSAGDVVFYEGILENLWFDAAINGDKVCWFRAA